MLQSEPDNNLISTGNEVHLNSFEEEIQMLKERLSMGSNRNEIQREYIMSCDLETSRKANAEKYKETTDPNVLVIFYIRTIIESVMEGSLTEKDIRASVTDVCRDLGVRATGRGTIAGLNLDVPSICGILASFGILEQDNSIITSIRNPSRLTPLRQNHMNLTRPASLDQHQLFQSSTANLTGIGERDLVDLEIEELYRVTGLNSDAIELFKSISYRWKSKLQKFFHESRSVYWQAQLTLSMTASSSTTTSASTTTSQGPVSTPLLSQYFNSFSSILPMEDIHNHNLPLPKTTNINNDFMLPMSDLPLSEPKSATDHAMNPNNINLSKTVKRAANQRAWKLSSDLLHLKSPERLIREWVMACYSEAASSETEECILRRLASQCGISLDPQPYRIGTRYLSKSPSKESPLPIVETSSHTSRPKLLRDGAQLNGVDLWEKARLSYVRRRMKNRGLHNSLALASTSDMISTFSTGFSLPHPSVFGDDRINKTALSRKLGMNSVTVASSSSSSSVDKDKHILMPMISARSRRAIPPMHLVYENDPVDAGSLHMQGSIFATQTSSSTSDFCTLVRPDIALRTSQISWSAVAKEFILFDSEELQDGSSNMLVTNQSGLGTTRSPRTSTDSIGSNGGIYQNITTKPEESLRVTKYSNGNMSNPASTLKIEPTKFENSTAKHSPRSVSTQSVDRLVRRGMSSISSKSNFVLAPTFREIEPISIANCLSWSKQNLHGSDSEKSDSDEIEEDIEDETMLSRHDTVLRNMRDRWLQLQQLRQELTLQLPSSASRSSLAHPSPKLHTPKDSSTRLTMTVNGSPTNSNKKNNYNNIALISPNKQGSILLVRKRGRGRPPKNHHYLPDPSLDSIKKNVYNTNHYVTSGKYENVEEGNRGTSNRLVNVIKNEEETDSAIDKDEDDDDDEESDHKKHKSNGSSILASTSLPPLIYNPSLLVNNIQLIANSAASGIDRNGVSVRDNNGYYKSPNLVNCQDCLLNVTDESIPKPPQSCIGL